MTLRNLFMICEGYHDPFTPPRPNTRLPGSLEINRRIRLDLPVWMR